MGTGNRWRSKTIEARLNAAPDPNLISAIQQLNNAVHSSGVNPLVLELVHLGEPDQRLQPVRVRGGRVGKAAWARP